MYLQRPFFIACALVLLSPTTAVAATISVHATPANIGVGDLVRVDVLLDSAISTNAFSGSLRYSSATLEPVAISDGNSIVGMWITRPSVTSADAPITFAGITPGGFSGDNGILFSILFKAKGAGTATISFQDIEVLRNDGVGGNEPTTIQPLALGIWPESFGGYAEPADQTPPEYFIALLDTDPPLFLFSLFPLSWNEAAMSPYAIAYQNLTSAVYIKAVDRAGNGRLSVFPPQHLFTGYEKTVLLAILIVFVFSAWIWQRRRTGKSL